MGRVGWGGGGGAGVQVALLPLKDLWVKEDPVAAVSFGFGGAARAPARPRTWQDGA